MKKILLAALAVLSLGTVVNAQTITFDFTGDGQLNRINNLVFGGERFNVDFIDGSCQEVFDGCDSIVDFDFQNRTDALAVSDALFTQVFSSPVIFNGELLDFATDPTRVFGCDEASFCVVAVPFGFINRDNLTLVDTVGVGILPSFEPPIGLVAGASSIDDNSGRSVFARFSSSIPEPATWLMMIIGFAGVGLMVRRRRMQTA